MAGFTLAPPLLDPLSTPTPTLGGEKQVSIGGNKEQETVEEEVFDTTLFLGTRLGAVMLAGIVFTDRESFDSVRHLVQRLERVTVKRECIPASDRMQGNRL